MKVGPRITAVTSALVAGTLAVYAFFDLRDAAHERRERLETETRALASTVRVGLEMQGLDRALSHADDLSRAISDSYQDVTIRILPARAARGDVSDPAFKRLRDILDARPASITVNRDDIFTYVLPLREPSLTSPDGYDVAGDVEVARSTAQLDKAWDSDLYRTLPLLAVIVVVMVVAVMVFIRTLVTGPIEKLLAGIDDVARGDLSRVLLSEREDEIGALASRFNEMTYSLRESRAETERQNAAKMKLEQRLFQTEKMATIGQLAAGDRPRGRHPAQRHRRPRPLDGQEGRRPGRGPEERRHRGGAGLAHHPHHPAPARLRPPQGRRPRGRPGQPQRGHPGHGRVPRGPASAPPA